ncbi:hypothetical protein ECE50_000550 [Chitinophaga sp. Mgbs1]|uniref:Uncharacterized protein n=1 Tax=Chitinophaga solisilvae TaxID=1233460 RepID=A0A9Q5D2Z0_9BACT|nr:hypothetical protein [Chitinophaga solisilvae]
MPKKLLLACLSALTMMNAAAQPAANEKPAVERSTPFDEPENGASRLLLMKNGNTLFFTFTRKKGINVTVYTPAHQALPLINSRVSSWKNKKMGAAKLEGFFEMNGQAVVFLQQYVHRKPCLYRFLFDGKTGKLVEEKLIGDLPRISFGQGYAIAFGGMKMPDFSVKKDPLSDYYAVTMLNSRAHETGERLRVIHFGPDHKIINDGYFDTPAGNYKYINLADMHVNGSKSVFLAAFAYNTRASGGKDSRFAIGILPAGSNTFKSALLDHTDDLKLRNAALKFNPADSNIYLLTTVYPKSPGAEAIMSRDNSIKLALMMNVVNPQTLALKRHYFVKHPMLDKYAQEHLKYKKKYQGVIQDFNLNADGSVQLLMEEMDVIVHTYTSTSGSGASSTSTTVTTRLGEIGISQLSPAGKETGGYAIAKAQEARVALDIFDLNKRNQSNWNFRGKGITGNNLSGFYSYDFFRANQKDYIIYNDYAINKENDNENYRSKKKVNFAGKTNTICAIYDGKDISKTYLYGEPQGNESRFSQMEMISRQDDGRSFATMMIERKGREKRAYIVWVKL